ncbi:MAG TPA: choice-of-anchor D domain-containing protein, partial [Candidatus Cloacimonetes bacterium]|nr:choice-of-anchor D domain-containing protein [Candidatus Cloacimonadota bacterium]
GQLFNGIIDEMRVWNVVRSETELRENMHIPLVGTETGLVSYWQFNEGTGTTATDIISGNDGTMHNMDEDDWIDSTIPFGDGVSDSQTETAGTVDFTDTGLSMYFNSHNSAEITVTRINATANINPTEPDEVFDAQYWVVNRYGNGTFDTDLTFTISEDLTSEDEGNPSQIKLYTRSSNADSNWIQLMTASSVNAANNEVTFDGITEFSQFIIGKVIEPDIYIEPESLHFGTCNIEDSIAGTITIYNTGNDTLSVSDISNNEPDFLVDMTICEILPGDSCNIEITFSPAAVGPITDTLVITSNDPDESITEIFLTGQGVVPEITLLKSRDFELITSNFNSIDVGYYSAPAFTDIDGDDLLDLIVGEENDTLNHYEQDAENSTSFTLVIEHINCIGVEGYSAPVFTDLDNDRLLDLILGKQNGTLNHYEQDAENSTSFSLVNEHFNSIEVGNISTPAFTDLDGDGLLDFIVGEYEGNLNHYEQDSVNSTSFTLITPNFNNIDVGSTSSPAFTDLDGDYLLDLIVGEYEGNLNHYEQDSINSTSFSLVTHNFNSLDVGYYSAPVFSDIDGDGLEELFIGELNGKIHYCKQETIDSMSFGNIVVGGLPTKNYYLTAINLINDLNIECPEDLKYHYRKIRDSCKNCQYHPLMVQFLRQSMFGLNRIH